MYALAVHHTLVVYPNSSTELVFRMGAMLISCYIVL